MKRIKDTEFGGERPLVRISRPTAGECGYPCQRIGRQRVQQHRSVRMPAISAVIKALTQLQ